MLCLFCPLDNGSAGGENVLQSVAQQGYTQEEEKDKLMTDKSYDA